MGTIGEIRLFAGSFAPRGWQVCRGQLFEGPRPSSLLAVVGFAFGFHRYKTSNPYLPDFSRSFAVGAEKVGPITGLEGHYRDQPSVSGLQLTHLIAVDGRFLSSEAYLGELQFWPGTRLPEGWILADGSTLPVSRYPELAAALGTTSGGGSAPTFQVPDLMGRAGIGAGSNKPSPTFAVKRVEHSYSSLIGLQPMISTQASDRVDPFWGEIRMFAHRDVPAAFMPCEGQTLSIEKHPPLFSLLRTTFGGDGKTHFALPDLRGHIPAGTREDKEQNTPLTLAAGDDQLKTLDVTYAICTKGFYPSPH